MDEAAKDQLTARFRSYLDGVDAASDGGLEAEGEPAPDLFTLLAEVVALKNEVKLESRQVKSALDEFSGLFGTLRESSTRLAGEQERRREQDRVAERQARKELLLELLELRDRLQAGQDQADRFRPRWPTRRSEPATARRDASPPGSASPLGVGTGLRSAHHACGGAGQ